MSPLIASVVTLLLVSAATVFGASVGALGRVGLPGRGGVLSWLAHGTLFGILSGTAAVLALTS